MSWTVLRANRSICKCGNSNESQQGCDFVTSTRQASVHTLAVNGANLVWEKRRHFTTCWKTQHVFKQGKEFCLEWTLVLGGICPLVTLSDPKVWWSDHPCQFPSEYVCPWGRQGPGSSRMFKDEEWGVSPGPFLAALLSHHLVFFTVSEEHADAHFTYAL